ncbi:hypothetical protein FRB90_007396, partial [Tulasnella sp. 427]
MLPSTVLLSILALATTSAYAQPTGSPSTFNVEPRAPSKHQHRAHAHSVQDKQKRQLKKRKATKRKA